MNDDFVMPKTRNFIGDVDIKGIDGIVNIKREKMMHIEIYGISFMSVLISLLNYQIQFKLHRPILESLLSSTSAHAVSYAFHVS